MTTTLHAVLAKLATLTPTDPLALAQAELKSASDEFEKAKTKFDDATAEASASIAALIKKGGATEKNRERAEKAQAELTTAKGAYESAQAKAVELTEKVHTLEKGHKTVNVSGSDKIQMACAYCAANEQDYDQEELVKAAVELTGKDTVGQYGYFRRICKLFRLFGIRVTITFPSAN